MSDADPVEQLSSASGEVRATDAEQGALPEATPDAASHTAPSVAPDIDPLLGTVLDGRYLIECVVGSGGFGVVYRAVHLQFDSPVAIKVLRISERVSDEERKGFIELFLAEGRLLFNLQALHSSIVRVFETGTLRGSGRRPAPYLVMEWLDGLSLDRELKHRSETNAPLPDIAEVIALLSPCVEGLARAHRTRIAHRDIKPGNIFLAKQGEQVTTKLLDFGLAKVAADSATTSAMLEQSGPSSSFTPGYGAPEQWLSRLGTTGPWTDVYSLALVCVELLCGRRALIGVDRAQLMAACLDGALRPTPNALGARVSDAVERVFARALALELRDRYRNVDDFWRALCDAAQLHGPMPSLEWEAWARGREVERAPGAVVVPNAQNAAQPSAAAADEWMQADTAPMASYAALPNSLPARRSLRPWLYAFVAVSVCAAVVALVVRNRAPQRVTTQSQAVLSVQQAITAPAPAITAAPQPLRVVPTAPPLPALRDPAVPLHDSTARRSPRTPGPHSRAHAGVAPILRGAGDPAADAPPTSVPADLAGGATAAPTIEPPVPATASPVSPESLLKHDALVRRK